MNEHCAMRSRLAELADAVDDTAVFATVLQLGRVVGQTGDEAIPPRRLFPSDGQFGSNCCKQAWLLKNSFPQNS